MKKIKVLAILFTFSIIMGACDSTYETLVGERGENVMPVITDINPAIFNEDLANSSIAFTVSLPEGELVDAAAVEITLDDKTVVFETISTFPASITINAVDAINALGVNIDNVTTSSVFFVYVTTEKNGRKTRSKTASLKVPVVCAFDAALAFGSYHEVSGGWQVEGDVTLVADPADPYTIHIQGMQAVEGLTGNGNEVVISIDPSNFAVTGGATVLADDLSEWELSYTNYTFELLSGVYNSCDGSYVLVFDIYVDQGGWGSYSFTFTRN